MQVRHDPRGVANAILDEADRRSLDITNLSLNKVLFFAHSDYLLLYSTPLLSTQFEAWQFGPVSPIVYHEFKHFGDRALKGRAQCFCPSSGRKVLASYPKTVEFSNFVTEIAKKYCSMSAGALVSLSHQKGGAWDLVWNGESADSFGLVITNELILKTSKSPNLFSNLDSRNNVGIRSNYAH